MGNFFSWRKKQRKRKMMGYEIKRNEKSLKEKRERKIILFCQMIMM